MMNKFQSEDVTYFAQEIYKEKLWTLKVNSMIYNKGKQILRWMPLWFIRCVGGNDLNFKMFFITKFETA